MKEKREVKILNDFRIARERKKSWQVAATEDFEFFAGKQHDDSDVENLRKRGIRALTINKIRPNIFLISGVQRQNRTDFRAYPEGEEDGLLAEVATKLLKNVMKSTNGEDKMSEQFEDGNICGEGWLEPYMDYTYDLINGALKLKKVSPFQMFVDPNSVEYDLSDAKYIVKFSPNLLQDQIIQLFPQKKKDIEKIEDGKINFDITDGVAHRKLDDYPTGGTTNLNQNIWNEDSQTEKFYDLTEYYYKKYVLRYIVIDAQQGVTKETDSKEEAEEFVSQYENTAIITRYIPEIWVDAMVGNTLIDSYVCQFYPQWKEYPFIPFFSYRITVPLKNREYMSQGIIRNLKDLQRELNKRRTQELVHLNSSTNSGWIVHKNARVNKADLRKKGSSSGYVLEWEGQIEPKQIHPMPLSQGHAQMAAENTNDLKEVSGINADLLAMNEKTQSGRAIHLRQKQGMVMIQVILDNLSRTKKILGRFIMSQLGQIYTVDTATKVCGSAFLQKNFSVPVMRDNVTPVMEGSEMKMEVDDEAVAMLFNQILTDLETTKYDIAVGEGSNSETVKYANYMLLMDLIQSGAPIPPDVIIDESMLPAATKEKIKQSMMAAQQQGVNP
ncbi:MAG: hypothetical protein DRP78_05570 [Candidatus Omnitrophota bacterium]|nr:MAG: hypothetical protein DRP78_05570 [Candidatus Omnitrophota bacterium]